jgi:hypothetical protein
MGIACTAGGSGNLLEIDDYICIKEAYAILQKTDNYSDISSCYVHYYLLVGIWRQMFIFYAERQYGFEAVVSDLFGWCSVCIQLCCLVFSVKLNFLLFMLIYEWPHVLW